MIEVAALSSPAEDEAWDAFVRQVRWGARLLLEPLPRSAAGRARLRGRVPGRPRGRRDPRSAAADVERDGRRSGAELASLLRQPRGAARDVARRRAGLIDAWNERAARLPNPRRDDGREPVSRCEPPTEPRPRPHRRADQPGDGAARRSRRGRILSLVESSARRNVRKAERAGIEVDVDAVRLVGSARDPSRQHERDRGPRQVARVLRGPSRATFGPGRISSSGWRGPRGETIAGLLVLHFNRVTEYFTPATRQEHRSDQPLALILVKAMIGAAQPRLAACWNWGGTWSSPGWRLPLQAQVGRPRTAAIATSSASTTSHCWMRRPRSSATAFRTSTSFRSRRCDRGRKRDEGPCHRRNRIDRIEAACDGWRPATRCSRSRRRGGPELEGVEWIRQDLSRPLDPAALPGTIDAIAHLAQSERYRDFPDGARICSRSTSRAPPRCWSTPAAPARAPSSSPRPGAATRRALLRSPRTHALTTPGPYFRSKRMAELLAENYADELGGAILRFFFAYGPGGKLLVARLAQQDPRGRGDRHRGRSRDGDEPDLRRRCGRGRRGGARPQRTGDSQHRRRRGATGPRARGAVGRGDRAGGPESGPGAATPGTWSRTRP